MKEWATLFHISVLSADNTSILSDVPGAGELCLFILSEETPQKPLSNAEKDCVFLWLKA